MTERNVSGDAVRSAFKRAQKAAADLGIDADTMDLIAAGAREFDAQRAPEARQAKALERIAANTTPPRTDVGDPWGYEERRLRRREVQAQELLAVVPVVSEEDLAKIQAGDVYKRIVARLSDSSDSASA